MGHSTQVASALSYCFANQTVSAPMLVSVACALGSTCVWYKDMHAMFHSFSQVKLPQHARRDHGTNHSCKLGHEFRWCQHWYRNWEGYRVSINTNAHAQIGVTCARVSQLPSIGYGDVLLALYMYVVLLGSGWWRHDMASTLDQMRRRRQLCNRVHSYYCCGLRNLQGRAPMMPQVWTSFFRCYVLSDIHWKTLSAMTYLIIKY